MTDRYLDETEVVSVIYYSDNKQTHMFLFSSSLATVRHKEGSVLIPVQAMSSKLGNLIKVKHKSLVRKEISLQEREGCWWYGW